MPLSILFIERKMMNNRFEKKEKKEKIIYAGEYSDRNNWCWGFPEYMEEYRLARGYEWRDGLLREKVDPRCLNEHGIPTNDFNLPAVPGMNTLPMNARIATKNRYLDQVEFMWTVSANGVETNKEITPTTIWFDKPKAVVWKINWGTDNWMIEIPINWNYMLQVYGMFIYPQGHDNNLIKNCILTLRVKKKWESEVGEVHSAHRSCISPDTFSYNTFEILKAGDQIGLWVSHSFYWESVQIIGWITILKLS